MKVEKKTLDNLGYPSCINESTEQPPTYFNTSMYVIAKLLFENVVIVLWNTQFAIYNLTSMQLLRVYPTMAETVKYLQDVYGPQIEIIDTSEERKY